LIIKDLAALEKFSQNFAEFLKSYLKEGENAENAVVQRSPQDIFLLFKGGLAAGKTTTISAIIKALGVSGESSSPTFMGMHEYSFLLNKGNSSGSISESYVNIQFYHLDLYQKNIDLDSVLELMDSDSLQIWAIEWSEKLDPEILDYLRLKHNQIKTLDIELKISEGDIRELTVRETFKDSCDFNKQENDEDIENEVPPWSQQELS
jgi:tRNA A37 threonylcarbamoyladenosine biosynthesis protein TsaE